MSHPEKLHDEEAQTAPPSRTPTFLADHSLSKEGITKEKPTTPARRRSSSSTSTLADDPDESLARQGIDPHLAHHPSNNLTAEERAQQEKEALFLVGWDGPDDPANPQNWKRSSRWYYTLVASLLVFNATFASSSPGGIVEKVMKEFTFGTEVATLMISLFVAGYCVGPLFWGPLSEIYGRKPIFIVSFIVYTAFQIGCALSPNTGALLGKLFFLYPFPSQRTFNFN